MPNNDLLETAEARIRELEQQVKGFRFETLGAVAVRSELRLFRQLFARARFVAAVRKEARIGGDLESYDVPRDVWEEASEIVDVVDEQE